MNIPKITIVQKLRINKKKLIHRVLTSISNKPHPITTANKRYALKKSAVHSIVIL